MRDRLEFLRSWLVGAVTLYSLMRLVHPHIDPKELAHLAVTGQRPGWVREIIFPNMPPRPGLDTPAVASAAMPDGTAVNPSTVSVTSRDGS